MKIALVGYGKMGREIEVVVNESGAHEIVSRSFINPTDKLDIAGIKKADVAIDFTSPEIVVSNIREISKLGINMVIGTTGWYEKISEVKEIVKKNKTGLIYGQNFSVGANIFFKITEFASKMFGKFGGYDVYGFEIHHKGKLDSPSGTAKKISEIIIDNFPQKKVLQNERVNRKIGDEELHFASIRGGAHPGFHEVIFDSPADEVRLTHNARGRRGFAQGAILAAEYIKDKKGFYHFDELFV